jgi:mono/diheme cytochrome c family protein
VYLLSLTAADDPASYVTAEPPAPALTETDPVARGKAVFEKYGCAGCHGAGGVGGRRNWNAGLGEEVPSLMYVKAYYGQDLDALRQVIQHGRQPVPRANPSRPISSLYMPAWTDRISDEDVEALIAYLFSLSDRLPAPPAPPAEAAAPPADADAAAEPAPAPADSMAVP